MVKRRWCSVQKASTICKPKCIRLFAFIINCTMIMKTNSRFSRNVYAIIDRIWCNKHFRQVYIVDFTIINDCLISAINDNLARNKPAIQSTDYSSAWVAGNAVDGNYYGYYSCTIRNDNYPYWSVDLGKSTFVDHLYITNVQTRNGELSFSTFAHINSFFSTFALIDMSLMTRSCLICIKIIRLNAFVQTLNPDNTCLN